MRYQGFVGGSSFTRAKYVNAERTINLYVEKVDQVGSKSDAWLKPTPGLTVFSASLDTGPVTQVFHQDGRVFCVSGTGFFELFEDGTASRRGSVVQASQRSTIVSNGSIGSQLFVVTGQAGYVYDLTANTLTQISDAGFPPGCLSGAFADSYFLAAHSGAPRFSFSDLADGTSWPGSQIVQKSQTSDNLRAMLYDHKEVWMFGEHTIEVWVNTGDEVNPWAPQPVLIEGGTEAPDSVIGTPYGVFWMRSSPSGAREIVRANGYRPVSIGNTAVSTRIESYAPTSIETAVGWFYEMDGHKFYVLSFPNEDETWVYDVVTGEWHEWLYWDGAMFGAHLARCHAHTNWGFHLVGSRVDGTIYKLDPDVYSDAGSTIRRIRVVPHLTSENKTVFHRSLELEMLRGVGLTTGQGSDPVVMLRYSDDGGATWSSELQASIGVQGNRTIQVRWTGLGASTDRVYEVSFSDPVFVGIADAYIETTLGRH